MKYAILITLCLCTATYAGPLRRAKVYAPIVGKVVACVDGDTLDVLPDGEKQPVRIRLRGIDAPEKQQPFGEKSKDHLAELVQGKRVTIRVETVERWGRFVGDVEQGKTNINRKMTSDGLAWWYRAYAPKDAELQAAEAEAKAAKRGLWVDKSPIAPWDWRKLSKEQRDKVRAGK